MPDLRDVQHLLRSEHGLAVVSTVQRDGRVLSSVINCCVLDNPVTGIASVAFVSAGSAARLLHIRRGSDVTITVRRMWDWIGITGSAAIVGPDDPEDAVDADRLRLLLREVFETAEGSHDNFDEYDQVMLAERRAAVFITPTRIITNAS